MLVFVSSMIWGYKMQLHYSCHFTRVEAMDLDQKIKMADEQFSVGMCTRGGANNKISDGIPQSVLKLCFHTAPLRKIFSKVMLVLAPRCKFLNYLSCNFS